eukprot:scaffold87932_cov29-Tisochrysis_lutea.AAC.1
MKKEDSRIARQKILASWPSDVIGRARRLGLALDGRAPEPNALGACLDRSPDTEAILPAGKLIEDVRLACEREPRQVVSVGVSCSLIRCSPRSHSAARLATFLPPSPPSPPLFPRRR